MMDKKVMSFNVFKKTLDPKKVEKYMDDALNVCYWNDVNSLHQRDLDELDIDKIQKAKEEYKLKMTEADYDAEGFIPAYLHYLEGQGKPDNLAVCLRWVIEDEMEALEDMEPNDRLTDLGAYWVDNAMTDFNYSAKEKYLHFFSSSNYRERNTFLQAIDDEDNRKTNLCVYLIDADLVEEHTGSGEYPDEEASYWENIDEIAIPSSKLRRSNFVESFDIEQTRCENYEQNRHIKKVLNSFYSDEEFYNGDDYEANFE